MSALTKVFVVLLVICSMLLTAAVVVFVNKQEPFATDLAAMKDQRDQKEAARAAAEAARATAQANMLSLQVQKDSQADTLRAQLASAQSQWADREMKLAQAQSQIQSMTTENQRLAEGIKASELSRGLIMQQLADSRKSVDDITKKYADLNSVYSATRSELDVAKKDLRNTLENLQLSQNKVAEITSVLPKYGAKVPDPSVPETGVPPIKGIIRAVQNIEGVPYATISVGASSNVSRNMKFFVVDRERGEFLGTLTVDSVGERDATGILQLKDDKLINRVGSGTEVTTVIQ